MITIYGRITLDSTPLGTPTRDDIPHILEIDPTVDPSLLHTEQPLASSPRGASSPAEPCTGSSGFAGVCPLGEGDVAIALLGPGDGMEQWPPRLIRGVQASIDPHFNAVSNAVLTPI